MGESKRRSVVADRSSGNYGDQPLSTPPDTPCPPFTRSFKPQNQQIQEDSERNYRNTPPWELAERIILLGRKEPSLTNWQTNDREEDLETTWDYHADMRMKRNASGNAQEAQPIAHTSNGNVQTNTHKTNDDHRQSGSMHTQSNQLTQSNEHGLAQSTSKETALPVLEAQFAAARRRQTLFTSLALVTSIVYIILLAEQMGLTHLFPLSRNKCYSVILSGLPGIFLACMCYIRLPHRQSNESPKDSQLTDNAILQYLSTRLTGTSMQTVRRSQEIHREFTLHAFKAVTAFVLCDMLKTYTSLSSEQSIPLHSEGAPRSYVDPPLFGPSPQGARIGISGYPPRGNGGSSYQFSSLSFYHPLLYPVVAELARLVGIWFAFKALSSTCKEKERSRKIKQRWFALRSYHTILPVLFALPLASSAIQQAIAGSPCGLAMPAGGDEAAWIDSLMLRLRALLLAVASALTGSVLAAAFERLSDRYTTRRMSRVLGVVASLSFFLSIVFDVLATGAPSTGLRCMYTSGTAHMHSGRIALKAFDIIAGLTHLLAQLCLSLSAASFGVDHALLHAAACKEGQIDDACIAEILSA